MTAAPTWVASGCGHDDRWYGRPTKPPPFDYRSPDSLEEALALLAEHGDEARPLAGGQSLVPLLALRLARPEVLVDIARVRGLDGISRTDGHVEIGATVREAVAERSGDVKDSVPLLAAALPLIGHPAIRSRGTVGGSLAHGDPAAELPAVALATGAEMVATSAAGTRTIPAAEFFVSYFTTALEADELLTSVRFPVALPGSGSAFEEAARRHGDFAMVGVAAMVTLSDGVLGEVALTMTGVADTPVRVTAAEAALRGAPVGPAGVDPAALGEAAAAASGAIDPPSDLHGTSAYRRHVAGVLVRRAVTTAAAGAGLGGA